jgi:hypothetical protein
MGRTEVLINGGDRLILKESDILGVIEDDAQARRRRHGGSAESSGHR